MNIEAGLNYSIRIKTATDERIHGFSKKGSLMCRHVLKRVLEFIQSHYDWVWSKGNQIQLSSFIFSIYGLTIDNILCTFSLSGENHKLKDWKVCKDWSCYLPRRNKSRVRAWHVNFCFPLVKCMRLLTGIRCAKQVQNSGAFDYKFLNINVNH